MLTINSFFAVATPLTLASLIRDIEEIGDLKPDERRLLDMARSDLEAIVGQEEMESMIHDADSDADPENRHYAAGYSYAAGYPD